MTEQPPFPNYSLMAAWCRQAASSAIPEGKAVLEEAAAQFDYLAKRPELMRALAYFSRDEAASNVLKRLPAGTRIDRISDPDDAERIGL